MILKSKLRKPKFQLALSHGIQLSHFCCNPAENLLMWDESVLVEAAARERNPKKYK